MLVEHHLEIKDKLSCINYEADRLTSTEKQQLRVENKEIPPTPKLLSESETKLCQSQAEEVKKPDNIEVSFDPVAVDVGSSGKAEEASQTKSEGIFARCGGFEKLWSF